MKRMALTFEGLLGLLQAAMPPRKAPRQASNAACYSLKAIVLGAFSVFFMQCEWQGSVPKLVGHRAAANDPAKAQDVGAACCCAFIEEVAPRVPSLAVKGLPTTPCLGGHLLVTLDATQYLSSHKSECPHCSSRRHPNGTITACHRALVPVIVAPGHAEVLA